MTPWNERPIEVANLFNPAFCTLVLREAISEYHKTKKSGLDYPIAFLILPVILSKSIREALPSTTITKLHTWLQTNQEIRIRLDSKIHSLSTITKEAILFGLQYQVLAFDKEGALIAPKCKLKKFDSTESEAASCIKKAGMLGRWFANAGDTITLLSIWGVKLF